MLPVIFREFIRNLYRNFFRYFFRNFLASARFLGWKFLKEFPQKVPSEVSLRFHLDCLSDFFYQKFFRFFFTKDAAGLLFSRFHRSYSGSFPWNLPKIPLRDLYENPVRFFSELFQFIFFQYLQESQKGYSGRIPVLFSFFCRSFPENLQENPGSSRNPPDFFFWEICLGMKFLLQWEKIFKRSRDIFFPNIFEKINIESKVVKNRQG